MPHVMPAELWQETGRWDQFGPQLLKIQDRAGTRLPVRADARGADHRHRAQGHPQLPPAAGQPLPDPGQVPRRDPPALRRHARPRVPDEGRVLVRRRPRRADALVPAMYDAYARIFTRLGLQVPRRRGRHRRDRRLRLARVPGARRVRRGRDRLVPRVRVRGQHRAGRGAGARRRRAPRRPRRCARCRRPAQSTCEEVAALLRPAARAHASSA